MRHKADNVIQEAIEEAKKEFLTEQKKKVNSLVIEDIIHSLNDAICRRVIQGTVILRLEISESKIVQYKVTETVTFEPPGNEEEA